MYPIFWGVIASQCPYHTRNIQLSVYMLFRLLDTINLEFDDTKNYDMRKRFVFQKLFLKLCSFSIHP